MDALDLLAAYAAEDSFVVWSELSSGFGGVVSAFFEQPEAVREGLRAAGAALYAPAYDAVGWAPRDGDGHGETLLRQLVVSRALAYKLPAAVAEARSRFDALLAGGVDEGAIPADLRGAVFASVVRNGGAPEAAAVRKLYAAAESAQEEGVLLSAMGAAPTVELVLEALEFNMTDDVRTQDAATIVGSAAANAVGRRATWEWMQANWDRVEARFGGGGVSSTLTRLVGASCGSLATEVR